MDGFEFGFWAWLGKTAADFALLFGFLIAIVIVSVFIALFEVFILEPYRKWRGICPRCGGEGYEKTTPHYAKCFDCSGSGIYKRD